MKCLLIAIFSLSSIYASGASVFKCNGKALVLYEDKTPGNFIAEVRDEGVVNWFEQELKKDQACGPGYLGGTTCIPKKLPVNAKFVRKFSEGKEVKRLVVSELRKSGNSYMSFMTPLTPNGNGGYVLSLGNSEMVNSHTAITYFIGKWDFETCK